MKTVFLKGKSEYKIHTVSSIWGNCYIIETEDDIFLVDTCEPGNLWRILRKIKKIGKKLRLIFITHAHFDHYGNAKKLRDNTGALIAVHKLDAELISKGKSSVKYVRGGGRIGKLLLPLQNLIYNTPETKPDIIVKEGYNLKKFGLDAVILHMPGHTAGHSALLLESKYIFVSDIILIQPFLKIQDYYSNDWSQLIDSFNRLKSIKPEIIFHGYGRPIKQHELKKVKYKHILRLAEKNRMHTKN